VACKPNSLRAASRDLAAIAFNLAIDVHRTLAPLSYPSHTIALACLYLATFFDPQHPHSKPPTDQQWPDDLPRLDADWAVHYACDIEHVEGMANVLVCIAEQLTGVH
jgi:CTD kinase subunit beta